MNGIFGPHHVAGGDKAGVAALLIRRYLPVRVTKGKSQLVKNFCLIVIFGQMMSGAEPEGDFRTLVLAGSGLGPKKASRP